MKNYFSTSLLLACTLTALHALVSCNNIKGKKTAAFPRSDTTNFMIVGDNIIFGESEVMGINREAYPADYYTLDIDNSYFKHDTSYSYHSASAGGSASHYEEYKALRAGKTSITRYIVQHTYSQVEEDGIKRPVSNASKTLYGTYNFIIK